MKNEMTERKFIENDLLLSGYSASDVSSLTEHLNDETALTTHEWMLKDVKLEMAHALSIAWLVRRLRSLADGSDAVVALAALEQLVKISLHGDN